MDRETERHLGVSGLTGFREGEGGAESRGGIVGLELGRAEKSGGGEMLEGADGIALAVVGEVWNFGRDGGRGRHEPRGEFYERSKQAERWKDRKPGERLG
ncbi:MAG: hypothetical protein CK538_06205 [Opitutia bacterium]|nr:MAG: hypothetical protein CK538_06205 [Opitutae bacterium]